MAVALLDVRKARGSSFSCGFLGPRGAATLDVVDYLNGLSLELDVQISRSNTHVAPEQVQVTVGFDDETYPATEQYGSFDDRIADSDIWITYGDPGSRHVVSKRIHPRQRDANVSHGWLGSHVYRKPGVYTIIVEAYDRKTRKTRWGAAEITVKDPDTVYPMSRTLYVDTSGTFLNAPDGALPFQSFSAARDYCRGQADPHRILCENGQLWTDPDCSLDFPDLPSIQVGLRDPHGPKVEIVGTNATNHIWRIGSNDPLKIKDLRIEGFKGTGPYDPTTMVGRADRDWVVFYSNEPEYVLLHDLESSGWHIHYNENLNSGGQKCISRISVNGWNNYGIAVSDAGSPLSKWALVDWSIRQKPAVNANGTGKKFEKWPQHGPLRAFGSRWLVALAGDARSGNGWPARAGFAAIQPCFRLNTNGSDNAKINIRNCHFEGGETHISYSPANDKSNTTLNVGMCIIGECAFLSCYANLSGVQAWHSGIISENCIRIVPKGRSISEGYRASVLMGVKRTSHPNVAPDGRAGRIRCRNGLDFVVRSRSENYDRVPEVPTYDSATDYDAACFNQAIYLEDMNADSDVASGPFDITTHREENLLPGGHFGYFDDNHLDVDGTPMPILETVVSDDAPLWVTPVAGSSMAADAIEGNPEDIPGIDFWGNRRAPRAPNHIPDRGPIALTP